MLRAARYRYRWSDPTYENQTDGIRAGLRAAPALTLTILVSLSVASSPPPSLPPTPPEPTPAIKAALAEYEYQLSLNPSSSECEYALVKLQAICNAYYASDSTFIAVLRAAAVVVFLDAVGDALGAEFVARLQALGLF